MECLTASTRLAAKLFEKRKDQITGFALMFFNSSASSQCLFHLNSSDSTLKLLRTIFTGKNALYGQQLCCSLTTGTMQKGLVRLVLSGAVVSAENVELCFCS